MKWNIIIKIERLGKQNHDFDVDVINDYGLKYDLNLELETKHSTS